MTFALVLASEGAEVKGYLKKQANSKVVRKHMHNGGTKSFDFHPSPRMVPHTCKPQVQFVELSIEQFVPRGKKGADDLITRSPIAKKITEEEKCLISRYFRPEEGTWKPSLIAFPRFQAFTSRVSRINHSYRTTSMLIDAMQRLQALSTFDDVENHSSEANIFPDLVKENLEDNDDFLRDEVTVPASEVEDKCDLLPKKTAFLHNFLFGEEFVTVDLHCRVSITSVPVLSFFGGLPSIQQIVSPDNVPSSPRETINLISRSLHGDNDNSPQLINSTNKSAHALHDAELSPRLSLFIETGVVPESPAPNNNPRESSKVAIITQPKANGSFGIVSPSPLNIYRHDDIDGKERNSAYARTPPKEHIEKTPVANQTMSSSSERWQINSAEILKSSHSTPKFKRLRRHRDPVRKLPCKVLEEKFCSSVQEFCQRERRKPDQAKSIRSKRKDKLNSNQFIEEEAEVSSDAGASGDEDEGSGESRYEDSFINDGPDSAETSGRGENSGTDMMAIYRRSLFTQSPAAMRSPFSPATAETGSCSSEIIPQTPGTVETFGNGSPALNSISYPARTRISNSSVGEVSKKLTFSHVDQGQSIVDQAAVVTLSDDDFYQGLDLDAVEAQAAELLRSKELAGPAVCDDRGFEDDFAASPSFDLGI